MPDRLLVFVTNELDELGIGEQALVYANRKGFFVSCWIFYGYVDLQRAVIESAEALRQLALAGQLAALHVEPDVVTEADGLDDERVAVPASRRIAVPPGLQLVA